MVCSSLFFAAFSFRVPTDLSEAGLADFSVLSAEPEDLLFSFLTGLFR